MSIIVEVVMDNLLLVVVFIFIMILVSIQYTLNKILMELRNIKKVKEAEKFNERFKYDK